MGWPVDQQDISRYEMGNNLVLKHLLVFLLLQVGPSPTECRPRCGMDVLCPEVTVETCSASCPCPGPCSNNDGCSCPCSCPCPCSRTCPFIPFPFYPPPAAPSYCVQSVVVGGRDDCCCCNKSTCVKVKKPCVRPILPPPCQPQPCQPQPCLCQPCQPCLPTCPPYCPTTRAPLHHRCICRPCVTKYQEYLEKMLDLLRDKVEMEEGPPCVVVSPKKCKCRRRKCRRCRRCRKCCMSSCEGGCTPVVFLSQPKCEDCCCEEDCPETPAIIIKHKSKKCCCFRPCGGTKCCCIKPCRPNDSDESDDD